MPPSSAADRLRDAGAEILRLVGGIGDAEPEDRGLQRRQRDAEIRHHEIQVEQQHDDRDAADHVDQAGAQADQHADAGHPHQRPEQPEHGRQHQRADGNDDRQPDALQQDRKNSTASLRNFCIGSGRARNVARASGHQEASAFCPHFSRILAMVPLAFSLASEALILASNPASLLRMPIATVPTVTGL